MGIHRMNLQTFLKNNYTVHYTDYNKNEYGYDCLSIHFNETKAIMMLRACPDCCDLNYFEFPESLKDLCNSRITNIEEVYEKSEGPNGDNEFHATYTIKIGYSRNDINKEIRFIRHNTSNGYYSGYLEIRFDGETLDTDD